MARCLKIMLIFVCKLKEKCTENQLDSVTSFKNFALLIETATSCVA